MAVARHLAGRAKALPPVEEQRKWEEERVVKFKGGKDYYSIAPDYAGFLELLRNIAGDPAPGTTGRRLPPFDQKWLEIWTEMVGYKIQGFERKARRAERELGKTKPRL